MFFCFFLFALPPVSRGLASIYIFRFPLPRPGFGKWLNVAGRPAAALTPRRDRRCLQLPFFYPPRSVTPIIPSRGWRRGGGQRLRVRKFSSPPAAFTRSPMASFCRVSFLDAFFAFSFDLDPFNRMNSRAGRNHFWVEARCPTTAGYYFFLFFYFLLF